MPEKVVDSLTAALWNTNMVVTRLLMGIAEFWWGLLLMCPGDTFGRPTYTYMAKVMSEEAWAFAFLLSSVIQVTIVIRKDFYCGLGRYFAAWNMVLWCFVVGSMLLSVSPPPAAISAEIAFAMASIWIWVRPFLLIKGIERAESRF